MYAASVSGREIQRQARLPRRRLSLNLQLKTRGSAGRNAWWLPSFASPSGKALLENRAAEPMQVARLPKRAHVFRCTSGRRDADFARGTRLAGGIASRWERMANHGLMMFLLAAAEVRLGRNRRWARDPPTRGWRRVPDRPLQVTRAGGAPVKRRNVSCTACTMKWRKAGSSWKRTSRLAG